MYKNQFQPWEPAMIIFRAEKDGEAALGSMLVPITRWEGSNSPVSRKYAADSWYVNQWIKDRIKEIDYKQVGNLLPVHFAPPSRKK